MSPGEARPSRGLRRILFVCSGNTCRSPLAEALARREADDMGISWLEVRSAGTGAFHGMPASEGASRAARRHGLSLDGHRSTPLTRELVNWADLILTMGRGHLETVRELGGGEKSALLVAYSRQLEDVGSSVAGLEVPDPFGGDEETYELTLETLREHVRSVLEFLAKESGS